jgi:hypothetical protein
VLLPKEQKRKKNKKGLTKRKKEVNQAKNKNTKFGND